MPDLDWKQQKNKCVADVGTIFCVELKADGWQCSATPPGGKPEVLATKLPNEKAAKRVATRAAKKPGAAAPGRGRGRGAKAAAKKVAAKKAIRKKSEESSNPQAETASPAQPAPAPELAPTPEPAPTGAHSLPPGIEVLTDGCLCGRVRGVRWVADHKLNIQYLADVKPSDHAAVQALVEAHFAKKRSDSSPPKPEQDNSSPPKPEAPVADGGARKAAKSGDGRRGPGRRGRGDSQKAAVTPQAGPKRGPGRPPKSPVSETPRRGPGRPPKNPPAADSPKRGPGRPPKNAKAETKRGPGRPPKVAAPAAGEPEPSEAPKRRGRPPKDPNAPRRGPGRPRKTPTAVDAASPEPTKESPGLRWIDVEGRRQATTAEGSWQIMPEGSSFGLYYLNPSGSSRFIASGPMSQLEQIAVEKQARGGMGESSRSTSAVEKLFDAELNGRT